MNVEILSNTVSVTDAPNLTNKFTMNLQEPIDCLNVDRHIKVVSVSYPQTTKNIYDDRCFFFFKITYANFRNDASILRTKATDLAKYKANKTTIEAGNTIADNKKVNFLDRTQLTFHSNQIDIPQGLYDLDALVDFFNAYTQEYDIYMHKMINGRIVINVGMRAKYLFKQGVQTGSTGKNFLNGDLNRWYYGDRDIESNGKQDHNAEHGVGGMRVQIYLSKKLNYLLGKFGETKSFLFEKEKKEMVILEANSSAFYDSNFKILRNDQCMYRDRLDVRFEAFYLPHVHDGINKIFVYCNEVEKQFVGDDKARLLCIVPLQYKGQGSGALVTHQFQNVVKKLNKQKIYAFHVELRDNEGNFIHFDSGSVNIQAIII